MMSTSPYQKKPPHESGATYAIHTLSIVALYVMPEQNLKTKTNVQTGTAKQYQNRKKRALVFVICWWRSTEINISEESHSSICISDRAEIQCDVYKASSVCLETQLDSNLCSRGYQKTTNMALQHRRHWPSKRAHTGLGKCHRKCL